MLRVTLGMCALVIGVSAVAAEQAKVDSRRTGENRFEVTVRLEGSASHAKAGEIAAEEARRLCGEQPMQLGTFRFDSAEAIAGMPEAGAPSELYVQNVLCGEAIAATPSTVPPAPDTPPTEGDERLIRDATERYLTALDNSEFDNALGMVSADIAEHMTETTWRAPHRAFSVKEGQARHAVVRVTWYDDPEGAPVPGRYAAADVRGDYDTPGFYCGYLMWLRQADGTYRVIREELALMESDVVKKLQPDQRAALRAQVQCRD